MRTRPAIPPINKWNDLLTTDLVKTLGTLIAIVDPIGGVPVFIAATYGWTDSERTKTARVVVERVCVLAVTDFLGTALLAFFCIGVP